jgi:hypothetical protein
VSVREEWRIRWIAGKCPGMGLIWVIQQDLKYREEQEREIWNLGGKANPNPEVES